MSPSYSQPRRTEFERVTAFLHASGIRFSETDPEDGRQNAVYWGGHTLDALKDDYSEIVRDVA